MYAQNVLKEYFRENNLNQASGMGNNLSFIGQCPSNNTKRKQ